MNGIWRQDQLFSYEEKNDEKPPISHDGSIYGIFIYIYIYIWCIYGVYMVTYMGYIDGKYIGSCGLWYNKT